MYYTHDNNMVGKNNVCNRKKLSTTYMANFNCRRGWHVNISPIEISCEMQSKYSWCRPPVQPTAVVFMDFPVALPASGLCTKTFDAKKPEALGSGEGRKAFARCTKQ